VFDIIRAAIEESIETKQRSLALVDAIAASAALLVEALRSGRKILVCGNGGSAADAQHFAAELMGRFEAERDAFPCVALTTDTSFLTAWSNDYVYDTIFARQVAALGDAGDVLVGISTSGNSPSVVNALIEASRKGVVAIALSGRDGGRMRGLPGVCQVTVPSGRTARIQEMHILIIHIWATLIDTHAKRNTTT
jgi:phosphoheptose isomerase